MASQEGFELQVLVGEFLKQLDVFGEADGNKRRLSVPHTFEDGTGSRPFLGEFFQCVFDRLRFVVGERAANAGHEGVRDGVGGEIDVGGVRDALGKLLGMVVPEVVENGQGAADFIGERHSASGMRDYRLWDSPHIPATIGSRLITFIRLGSNWTYVNEKFPNGHIFRPPEIGAETTRHEPN
ncbi:hypothetical protein [Burkholderia contaminans]|uniref:hypothetical protein n=1 Tax=Burkholderia contaminans TaxID=488447 RepID=UPI002D8095DE|nr:hypothetical protein [Burkholderia contaminans]